MGGAAVLHGESLYRLRAGALPFTYPPFAAVVAHCGRRHPAGCGGGLADGGERGCPAGHAVGLATGFKLTPAIFAVYLLLTRRYRAAATAAVVSAGTVAAGFAVLPASSAWFWAGKFASPGRVSPAADPENQSLLGVLSRTLHTANVLPLWLPLAAAVAVTGRALATASGGTVAADTRLARRMRTWARRTPG